MFWLMLTCVSAGAAGNFLASINQLSANAFKSVIDIDVLGSYNTLKATLPYLVESAKKHRINPDTRMPPFHLACAYTNNISETLSRRHRRPNHLHQRHDSLQNNAIPDACFRGQGRNRCFVAQRCG